MLAGLLISRRCKFIANGARRFLAARRRGARGRFWRELLGSRRERLRRRRTLSGRVGRPRFPPPREDRTSRLVHISRVDSGLRIGWSPRRSRTLPVELELSSGAAPAADDQRTLIVYPPFRFNARVGSRTFRIVEADSDASFRAVNARNAEAQAAPRNRYVQTYLEGGDAPRAGDLRISVIAEGDPVIVGSVFVHQRTRK